MLPKAIQLMVLAVLAAVMLVGVCHACKISEYPCRGGASCVPLDKYCDGRDDCGDGSDEPKMCTVCNRTYYGDIGRTYTLTVPPPQWNRLPFLCHLTFTASGHEQGDIVQIIFDKFTVGRFDEGLIDPDMDSSDASLTLGGDLPGCPEGFMQLSELGRPFTGGSWCGKASGHQLYFSETSTVTASVKVFHAPMQAGTPFEFRIRYKFISQSEAIVRYGAPSELLELGRVTPGTYCTRQYDECYRKKCRLQSPNYPGMYPRNVTCYWTIRQKVVPTCKHAMVAISQENEHKALVKRSIASLNKTSRAVRAWSDCTGERDHLIFYDGSSTNDPVLAKYCGGDWLPRVVSRGPEMLIAFHSSPFSAPLQSGQSNRGFELDVDILFADSDSYDFAQGSKCEFHINASNPDEVLLSRRGRIGHLLSPRHTLAPNTTCTYYFHGMPTDLIWISFTHYHLQILQPNSGNSGDNSTIGRSDTPLPWITRTRIWDSAGTFVPVRTTSPATILSSSSSSSGTSPSSYGSTIGSGAVGSGSGSANLGSITTTTALYQQLMNRTVNSYYTAGNQNGKSIKINVDNVWNPVDQYIYGPTVNSVFNQPPPTAPTDGSNRGRGGYGATQDKYSKHRGGKSELGTGNYVQSVRHGKEPSELSKDHARKDRFSGKSASGPTRRLMAEFYDNEAPKLCDHMTLDGKGHRMRPCTPLESYVSTGQDLKIEFHTMTGTSLFPSSFGINYEFVDTELGGEPYLGVNKRPRDPHEDPALNTDPAIPLLCSRVFRKRKGDFQAPRNVFLHGRGGAKNISCLYRFEASVGERVRVNLHNVSFGAFASCATESDGHTGRARCSYPEAEPDSRTGELSIYDVPYPDVRIPLGCFCDNTSISSNAPLTFISNSRILELTFDVTRLNISEDFADVYFHASYDFIRVPECRRRLRLRGSGGEDELHFPLRSNDASCDGQPWYIEAQQQDRSLFVRTWGSFLPVEPTAEDFAKCNTRNRLIVYGGVPLKVMRVICPSAPSSRSASLHIFSEDWLSNQPFLSFDRPVSMVLEPIHKEPGSIGFSWLEIQRTKASLIQQLDLQTNFTANDTLVEFGLYPRETECEYRCPELDACIGSALWCDGRPNCPSGYDESEQECGSRLIELPGGMYAAFGCVAAAISACLIFCLLVMVKKRRKANEKLKPTVGTGAAASLNGTLSKKEYKKEPLFFDPDS
ncbi:uncharacterized protein LOC118462806 [Anopheles albimanus]|nr:uncharacterized protein LOC118462806 [Anopheles albimanus]XP_035784704.1 uncharacterized protein LOC118462806 [Anopheles albimanus]XP_035784705.1 uncharacterized protein LOC118462806 [Anopheles albimanus]XP_035784706.1 uncharacterized protein LOC118462806 [Anopheles albimanus]XP_035784707.1 uncharacterized protein LOC118462806 [Anopheles albimanus]XP_035784708.1 uncharacterized protein LOC118462806 [Anopheles albimanus]XP_035784709.1 uncharacterized protein LOC118462806 [Anopheles albimanu